MEIENFMSFNMPNMSYITIIFDSRFPCKTLFDIRERGKDVLTMFIGKLIAALFQ